VEANDLNFKIQHLLPGHLVSYKSIDTVCDTNETVNYPGELLKSLDLQGMTLNHLQLKVGSPIITSYFEPTKKFIKKLMKNVIFTIILNVKFRGEDILLLRIHGYTTDVLIKFKRVQFPIRLTFAMTINKFQGQTMSVCG